MVPPVRVLLVEDDPDEQAAFKQQVARDELLCDYTIARSCVEAREHLETQEYDIALISGNLQDGESLELLAELQPLHLPVVINARPGDEETVIQWVNLGAQDYLIKTPDHSHFKLLPIVLQRVLPGARNNQPQPSPLPDLRVQPPATLRQSEARLKTLLTTTASGLVVIDQQERILLVNPLAELMLGEASETLLGQRLEIPVIANAEEPYEVELCLLKGQTQIVEVHGAEIEWDGVPAYLISLVDVTDRKRQERLLSGQRQVLELLAQGGSLTSVLTLLIQVIEAQSPGMLGSVLLLEGEHLYHGAAPSLPEGFFQAAHGIQIGPQVGSCGTAAYRREPVIVADIATDPLWAEIRDLPLGYGLRSCWSMPISSKNGEILGTFAMYYREAKSPTVRDWELVDRAIHLAGLAIERKRIEAQLCQYQRVVSYTADGLALIDRQYTYQLVNQVYSERGGKTPDDFINRPVREVVGEVIFETVVKPSLDQCFAGATVYYEDWLEHPVLGTRYFTVIYSPYIDAAGEIVGAVVSSRDITDRKTAEMALSERETEFRGIFEQAAVGIDYATLDGQLVAVNHKFCEIFGYSRDELLNTPYIELTHPEDVAADHTLNQQLLKGEIPFFSLEKRYRRKDGSLLWGEVTVCLVRGANGEPRFTMGIVQDISLRKTAEAALRRSEETNLALIQAIPDLLIRMHGDGTYLDIRNRSNVHLLNPDIALIGVNSNQVLPPELALLRQHYSLQALESQQVQTYEQQVVVGGETYFEEVRIAPCGRDEILIIVRDITDRKRAEASLQSLVEGAAAVTGGNFFSMLAQYIATVLGVRYVVILQRQGDRYQTHTVWANGQMQPGFSIPLEKTPWAATLDAGLYSCPNQVQQQFPESGVLVELGAESYLGVGLLSAEGHPIGILSVLDDKPLIQQQRAGDILRVFAARVSAELERQNAIDALHQLNQELELRVEQRTAELQQTNFRLQQAIAERQQLVALVENSTDCIVMATPGGRVTYLNWVGRNLVGLDETVDITGLTIADFHFPEDWADLQKTVVQSLQQGTPWQGEVRLRHFQSGAAISVQHSAFPIRHSQTGGIIALAGILRDMTEQKQRELENQLLRERLQFVLSSNPAVILTCKPQNYDITFVSDNIDRVTGYSAAEWLSEPAFWINHIHPDDVNRLFNGIPNLLEQDSHIDEYRLRHREGHYCWVQTGIRVIRDPDGTPIEWVGYLTDISDRMKTEMALRESEARNRAILGAIPDLLLRLKRDGTCLNCFLPKGSYADSFLPVFNHLSDVLPPELLQYQLNRIEQAIQTGELQIYEHQFTKLNQVIYEEVRVMAINDEEVLVMVRDITDRKQAEAQLRQANDQLVLANAELARATRLKDEFLANMSHELRTPLNAVLGLSEGLQEQVYGELNQRQQKAISTIERSGKHLLDLINDILDLAKVESGKLELQIVPNSVQVLCNSSVSFIKQIAYKKNIQIVIEIEPGLDRILADELRMRQVLINLLSNAVKFTPEGGRVTLEVGCDRGAAIVQFHITDTGIGIAPEDISKLFQSFVQIDSRLNRQYSGTGLGLALVKRIVELHQGTIQVNSTVGQGSCFTVTLPYQAQ